MCFIIAYLTLIIDDRDIDSTLNEQYISDVIKVSVLPEKKGSALWKHTEYEVRKIY